MDGAMRQISSIREELMNEVALKQVETRIKRRGCRFFHPLLWVWFFSCLWGCAAPVKHDASRALQAPQLASSHFLSSDGRVIPVRTFLPGQTKLRAVVIALHGFNDYSRAFTSVGSFFAGQGIGLIAYDQRGFGLSERTGIWAGASSYGEDLDAMTRAVKQRYPGLPLFLLGESMGAAVVITALHDHPDMAVEGVILSAPAVWSRDTMPWYQSLIMDLAASLLPEVRLTGSGLRVQASDNLEMLRGLGRDPWVIKATRIDAIQGLADLMDAAQAGIDQVKKPLLILYGGKDEIIPQMPVKRLWERISAQPDVRAAYYPGGFHLLLRDLNAALPLRDAMGWMNDPKAPLVSGCELQSVDSVSGSSAFQVSAACLSDRADVKRLDANPM